MTFRLRTFVAVGLLTATTFAQSIPDDTASLRMPNSFPSDSNRAPASVSPYVAAGASLVLPGLGQILVGSPVKGGVTMAIEAGLYGSLWQMQQTTLPKLRARAAISEPIEQQMRTALAAAPQDTSAASLLIKDSVHTRMTRAADSAFKNRERIQSTIDNRDAEIAWAIGLHAWSVIDAWEDAWHQSHPLTGGKSPLTAILLSAVVPGAGQIYNERYGKSAMLWMSLSSFWLTLDVHQKTLDFYYRENDQAVLDGRSRTDITEQLDLYRKRRNQYYWGIGLLYFYQMIDAAVDARLDNSRRPFQMSLVPHPEGPGALAMITF
jgi:TM2 domain-containing membrane protein YozV